MMLAGLLVAMPSIETSRKALAMPSGHVRYHPVDRVRIDGGGAVAYWPCECR